MKVCHIDVSRAPEPAVWRWRVQIVFFGRGIVMQWPGSFDCPNKPQGFAWYWID